MQQSFQSIVSRKTTHQNRDTNLPVCTKKNIHTEHDAYKGEPCFSHENAGMLSPSSARLHGTEEGVPLASLSFSHQERMPLACILRPTRRTKCPSDVYLHHLVAVGGRRGVNQMRWVVMANKEQQPPATEDLAWLATPPSGFPFSQRPSRTTHASSETLGIGCAILVSYPSRSRRRSTVNNPTSSPMGFVEWTQHSRLTSSSFRDSVNRLHTSLSVLSGQATSLSPNLLLPHDPV